MNKDIKRLLVVFGGGLALFVLAAAVKGKGA